MSRAGQPSQINSAVLIHRGMSVDNYLQSFRDLEEKRAAHHRTREAPPRKFVQGNHRVYRMNARAVVIEKRVPSRVRSSP